MAASNHRPTHDLKQALLRLLEPESERHQQARRLNTFLIVLILLNVLAVVLQTVNSLAGAYAEVFLIFEIFSVTVFSVEYLARLWVSTAKGRYAHGSFGRLRYALSPLALIDLIAILPFFIAGLPLDLRFLRLMRLVRLARILKLGRYSNAMQLISRILVSKKEELAVSLAAVLSLLLVTASLMYFIENGAQPEAFSSIPATMWWAIATLTTVGYGDVYPITALGKVFGSLVAILCLGLFALPAGIVAGGFSDEMQRLRSGQNLCPYCGRKLETAHVEPE